MATYTVAGHPLGASPIPGANAEPLHAALQNTGVGATFTLTLTGPEDTTMKAHGALK